MTVEKYVENTKLLRNKISDNDFQILKGIYDDTASHLGFEYYPEFYAYEGCHYESYLKKVNSKWYYLLDVSSLKLFVEMLKIIDTQQYDDTYYFYYDMKLCWGVLKDHPLFVDIYAKQKNDFAARIIDDLPNRKNIICRLSDREKAQILNVIVRFVFLHEMGHFGMRTHSLSDDGTRDYITNYLTTQLYDNFAEDSKRHGYDTYQHNVKKVLITDSVRFREELMCDFGAYDYLMRNYSSVFEPELICVGVLYALGFLKHISQTIEESLEAFYGCTLRRNAMLYTINLFGDTIHKNITIENKMKMENLLNYQEELTPYFDFHKSNDILFIKKLLEKDKDIFDKFACAYKVNRNVILNGNYVSIF